MRIITAETDGSFKSRLFDRLLFLTAAPTASDGEDGDYAYYDGILYGPKAGGVWPVGVRLQDNVTQGTATGQFLIYNSVSGKFEPQAVADLYYDLTSKFLKINATAGKQLRLGYSDSVYADFAVNSTGFLSLKPIGNSVVFPMGTSANPGIALGDGDTGFYESTDDIIRVVVGGNTILQIYTTFTRIPTSGYFSIYNGLATKTLPVYAFYSDEDTGIGRAGVDQLSVIAGGVEGIRISENTNIDVAIYGETEIISTQGEQLTLAYIPGSVETIFDTDANGDLTVYQTGDETFYSGMSSTQQRIIYSIKRTMPVSTDASYTSQVNHSVYSYNGAVVGMQVYNDGSGVNHKIGAVVSGNYIEIDNNGNLATAGTAFLKDRRKIISATATTATTAVDLSTGNSLHLELQASTTVNFTNPPASGFELQIPIRCKQDSTGGYTISGWQIASNAVTPTGSLSPATGANTVTRGLMHLWNIGGTYYIDLTARDTFGAFG